MNYIARIVLRNDISTIDTLKLELHEPFILSST